MCSKNLPFKIFIVCAFLFFLPKSTLADMEAGGEDKVLSPYFLVKAKSGGADLLPLKETTADVNIAGVVADVKITQVYKNQGDEALEAIYVFPGSTKAAVYGMQMTIGERIRVAKIKEKKQAKKDYVKAKKAGKSASLLEQHRPNVFQMSVANIMPGDEVKVELFYTEHIVPTDGIYQFVYPTVVGPRYSDTPKSQATEDENWVSNPYLSEAKAPNYSFDINVNLLSGIPLQQLSSSSHEVKVEYHGENQALVSLKEKQIFSGDRDYILSYRLEGGKIETGMQVYKGEDENFFLMMVQPPKRVVESIIPRREYLFVVDVSGSMYGFPLNTSKTLLENLIANLNPEDTFNVLLFAASSSVLWEESASATDENLQSAINFIERQRGGGGTRLLPALQRAFDLPHDDKVSRNIVIVTDGYVSVETDTFELIRNNLGNANVFSFGIGSSVNRFLIEGIARAGFGEPFIVTKPHEGPFIADKFREYIQTPVLTNIEIDWGDFDAYDVEPLSIPDVLADRPVLVYGKWKGELEGDIKLKGFQGNKTYSDSISLSGVEHSDGNSSLRYLWARNRIAMLGDYEKLSSSDERIDEITNMGLTYNLLTKYTSFIAIDDVVRNSNGKQKTVKQALPLPKGVSNLAVGGQVPTVPEPETYMLLGIISLLLIWQIKDRNKDTAKALGLRK